MRFARPTDTDPAAQLIGPLGGGSDDIGDISWNVPTVVLRYSANISGTPGHNRANGIAMATPIAHNKGVVAGAKVQAMTMVDLLPHPEIIQQAWTYFRDVRRKTRSTSRSFGRMTSRQPG